MAAVPIYVWNGTAWQETGPTIPASPIKYQASAPTSPSTGDIWVDSDADVTSGSQQFQRFRFVASGGETTISGADANGAVLAYTAGAELVVLNGSTLVRGQDYTATNGTSITGLSPALVANDVLEVFSFIAFNVANTYTQSQVDGLLDSYVGLRLITPTSVVNGTIGATGAVTFSGVTSVSLNGCFSSTYDNYLINFVSTGSTSSTFYLRLRAAGTDSSTGIYHWAAGRFRSDGVASNTNNNADTGGAFAYSEQAFATTINMFTPYLLQKTSFTASASSGTSGNLSYSGTYSTLHENTTTAYDGITIYNANTASMTGTVRVYGYKN